MYLALHLHGLKAALYKDAAISFFAVAALMILLIPQSFCVCVIDREVHKGKQKKESEHITKPSG
jgi:hypothetical protein